MVLAFIMKGLYIYCNVDHRAVNPGFLLLKHTTLKSQFFPACRWEEKIKVNILFGYELSVVGVGGFSVVGVCGLQGIKEQSSF